MGQFSPGQPIRRVEDRRLLTGNGRFLDDVNLPRQLHAAILRSPHAHARIRRIDVAAAAAMPGVVAVLTGADLAADGIGPLYCTPGLRNRDGSPIKAPGRPVLASERVRHVGDAVAVAVAKSPAAARDAADAIAVDYDPLPVTTGTEAATAADAALVWDEVSGNLCIDWEMGDRAAVDRQFAQAAHVCRLKLVNNRLIVNSLETRGAIGAFDRGSGRYVLHTSSQGVHYLRNGIADKVLKIPRDRLRVVTPDVGGGFGMKTWIYPEQVIVLWAARRLGRPVKWVAERSESFMSDTHGRDQVTTAELALDGEGRFLALRVDTIGNLGAYASDFGPFIPTVAGSAMLAGLYMTPAVYVAVRCVYTNTVPVDAYRGAGRPEAAYVVERIVDAAARELGLSPDEIRRRNFIPSQAMPYRTALGATYDSGEFARNMSDAMRLADWDGMPARRDEAKMRGRRRGIGMATYVEHCGGGVEEMAEIRFEPDGAVTLLVGSQNNGQGHETAFAQLIADRLGVPPERIRIVQGDSDQIPFGNGTGGSRMLAVAGSAVDAAAGKIVAKAKRIAATLLETAEADIEFADGIFTVAGTDRSVTIAAVAEAAYDPKRQTADSEFGLAERSVYLPQAMTYPNGCHVAEVEVDVDTGVVDVVRYTVVDDFGKVLNPLTLAGQVHGGTAQGIGQALFEHVVYEQSGQLLSGSMVDYRLPRAGDLPSFTFSYNEIPCATNPMGVKGAGEAGAIGAPPAVMNALVDALAEFGIRHVDMPATPVRIWQTIQAARATA